jgi:hypothetical protein
LEVFGMKMRNMAFSALGAVALVGATLSLTMHSNAQGGAAGSGADVAQGPPGAPGAGPRGSQGFPGPPGAPRGDFGQGRGGGFPMMGGGGSAMDSDNAFLYVLQGNMLFKVSKSDLRVVGRTPLMDMQMPGGGETRPSRGAGAPPPPPPSEDK